MLPDSAVAALRRWSLATMVANIAIVLVGGIVRVTGSGLGCSSYPGCEEGAVFPTVGIDEDLHAMIEFGNRMFSGVVAVAVIGFLVAATRARTQRPDLFRRAVAIGVLVVVQIGMGAATVNSGLHPLVVAAHFLISAVIVAIAVSAWDRAHDRHATEPSSSLRWVALGAAVVTAVILVLGTLLTAAGPHAGDEDVERLGLDIRTFAVAHADAVWLLVGLTVAGLAVSMANRHRAAVTAFAVLLGLELVQGTVGYVQYVTGIPAELVGVHILGSMLVWAAAVHAAVVTGPRS